MVFVRLVIVWLGGGRGIGRGEDRTFECCGSFCWISPDKLKACPTSSRGFCFGPDSRMTLTQSVELLAHQQRRRTTF